MARSEADHQHAVFRCGVPFRHFTGCQAGLFRHFVHVGREFGFVAHRHLDLALEFLRRGQAFLQALRRQLGRELEHISLESRIEMQRDPAQRRHHVAQPRQAARAQRDGKALHHRVHFGVEGARELDVCRAVSQGNDAQWPEFGHLLVLWFLRERNADHRVARHQRSEPLLAPALRARRAHRQHHVAHVGGRVVHPDAGLPRDLQPELR